MCVVPSIRRAIFLIEAALFSFYNFDHIRIAFRLNMHCNFFFGSSDFFGIPTKEKLTLKSVHLNLVDGKCKWIISM